MGCANRGGKKKAVETVWAVTCLHLPRTAIVRKCQKSAISNVLVAKRASMQISRSRFARTAQDRCTLVMTFRGREEQPFEIRLRRMRPSPHGLECGVIALCFRT